MTTWTDWSAWTYFLVDGDVISRGRIISYDRSSRMLKFYKNGDRSASDCPHPIGSAEYKLWLEEIAEERYKDVWVDPAQKSILSLEDYNSIKSGKKPNSFIGLDDQDPQEYFAGEASSDSFLHLNETKS